MNLERLSLFATIVDDVLFQDPDLENAEFKILDFSAPAPGKKRGLKIINAQGVPRLSSERKAEMLSTFAEGYFLAEAELAATASANKERERPGTDAPSQQQDLFDRD